MPAANSNSYFASVPVLERALSIYDNNFDETSDFTAAGDGAKYLILVKSLQEQTVKL